MERRKRLGNGQKSIERGSTFARPRSELQRTELQRSPAKRTRSLSTRTPVSAASPAQREKVAGAKCIVCGEPGCDPAHLIDRSIGGDDDPLAVVPICRKHHRAYDEGGYSLLEHLEPEHRAELSYAVGRVGLLSALQRITNRRWVEADRTWGETWPE